MVVIGSSNDINNDINNNINGDNNLILPLKCRAAFRCSISISLGCIISFIKLCFGCIHGCKAFFSSFTMSSKVDTTLLLLRLLVF